MKKRLSLLSILLAIVLQYPQLFERAPVTVNIIIAIVQVWDKEDKQRQE
jgi:ABC-type polar amino acid transport system ATPase subunit